jgi:hypothetical protein
MIEFILIEGNKSQEDFVNRLNQEYGHKSCLIHSNEKTKAGVDFSSGSMKIIVLNTCCDLYKAKVQSLQDDITSLAD